MPVRSKAMWKKIQVIRTKYKTKANTPEKEKWVWNPEWFEGVDYSKLPDKVSEEEKKNFKGNVQIIGYWRDPDVLDVSINGKKYSIYYIRPEDYERLRKEKDDFYRFQMLKKFDPKQITDDILNESIESIQDYYYQFATDEEKKKWETNNRSGQLKLQTEFEKKKQPPINLIRGVDAPLIVIGTMTEKDDDLDNKDIEEDMPEEELNENVLNEDEFSQALFRALDELYQNMTDCINNMTENPKGSKQVLYDAKIKFNSLFNSMMTDINAKINKAKENAKDSEEEITEE